MGTNSQSQSPSQAALLATKLFIPPARADIVSRHRLTERLNQNVQRKLTLISAPAGFGKTTLLGEWIPRSERCVTWVSLDKGDNEPVRFWTYIIAALQTLQSDLGKNTQALLNSPQPPSYETTLTRLVNEITNFADAFVLVLDDYHVIETQAIHQALMFFVEHQPRNIHLVVTSRVDPPLPLSRLRARNEMIELRADDLRFTIEESAAFLNEVMKIGVEAKDVAALDGRTEGWIAGLQLAALSMQGRNDISDFIKAFTGDDHYILDYLIEEVFRHQPEAVQDFLLQTSVLDRLCGPLCDAMLSSDSGWFGGAHQKLRIAEEESEIPNPKSAIANSQAMLEQLERANLFLFPLDGKRHWFRYHHLFADLLRFRLQQTVPGKIVELHLRASQWFEDGGFMEEAIRHAVAGKHWERAAELMEKMALKMLALRRHSTLEGWVKELPDEALQKRPELCLWYAYTLLPLGNLERCEYFLKKAEAAWHDEAKPHKLCALWMARALSAFTRGDVDGMMEFSGKAIKFSGSADPLTQVSCDYGLAAAYFLSGRINEAETVLRETIPAAQVIGYLFAAALAAASLGYVQGVLGKLREAGQTLQEVLRHEGLQFPEQALYANALLGDLERERNNLDAAKDHLRKYFQIAQQSEAKGYWLLVLDRLKCLVKITWTLGDREQAFQLVEQDLEMAKKFNNTTAFRQAQALRARLWLSQGDLAAAARWVEDSKLDINDELSFGREIEYLVFVRVRMAQNKHDDAEHLLSRLLQAAKANGRMRSVIEILVLQALSSFAQHDVDEAVAALLRALELAEPEGYIRTFVDEGAPMAELLTQILETHRQKSRSDAAHFSMSYLEKIIAAFPFEILDKTNQALADEKSSQISNPEGLTPREIEVLGLIAEGKSNDEIAQKLFLSTRTVERHISNLYMKIGISGKTARASATAYAIKQGLA